MLTVIEPAAAQFGRSVERKTVNVLMLDIEGEERWRWTVQDAYPVKWVGPELKAVGSAVKPIR